jgi:hypothetical protein
VRVHQLVERRIAMFAIELPTSKCRKTPLFCGAIFGVGCSMLDVGCSMFDVHGGVRYGDVRAGDIGRL